MARNNCFAIIELTIIVNAMYRRLLSYFALAAIVLFPWQASYAATACMSMQSGMISEEQYDCDLCEGAEPGTCRSLCLLSCQVSHRPEAAQLNTLKFSREQYLQVSFGMDEMGRRGPEPPPPRLASSEADIFKFGE
jgi:hypothetical protein